MSCSVALVLILAASLPKAVPLRLADVLAEVEAHGPDQRAASGRIDVARADTATARMFPNPGVSIGGGRAEPAFNASVILRLPIFGQRGLQIRAADASVRQTEQETNATRWRLRRDARIAYYTVAKADEAVAISVEVEQLAGRIAAMALEKLQVGSGNRLDERQAALVHVRAQQDVVDRRALAHVARIELARQLGRSAEDLGPIADSLTTIGTLETVDELTRTAIANHPELRALTESRRAALIRADAARAELRPTLTLEAGAELLDATTCSSNSRCWGPRGILGFDLPIFNFNRGPVDRARAEARLADLKAAASRAQLDAEVRAAYATVEVARARVKFFDDEYVPGAIDVEKMAREGFAVGRSGILPLIEAERAVLDARLGRIEALYSAQTALADLEEATGVPMP